MQAIGIIEQIRRKFVALEDMMDERMRRQWAATQAAALGWGGVTAVSTATGMACNTVLVGLRGVKHRQRYPQTKSSARLWRVGGGRKRPSTKINTKL